MIKTPQTHPDHPTVGKYFRGYDQIVYFCDSYDSDIGFWMTPIAEGERKNVSERAIGRTFHQIYSWQYKQFGITEEAEGDYE